MDRKPLTVPVHLRRGAAKGDEEVQIEQGVRLLELVRKTLGVSSLAAVDLLDVGCGTKVAQAILNREIPIGSYTGVDVYAEMIAYLRENVSSPELSFHAVDFQNDMYNPDGQPMDPRTPLPLGGRTFDAITAFSVFTHLAPEDYRALLGILRHHARDATRLLFTLFIDPRQTEPFRDAVPGKPLLWAYYSEAHARALVEGSGWEATELHPPGQDTQHYFVCRPV
jgi:SAM-dependent methyltransferase